MSSKKTIETVKPRYFDEEHSAHPKILLRRNFGDPYAARADRSVFSPHRIAYGDVCGDLLEHPDQRIRTVKPRYLSVRQGNQTPADRSILSVCDCSRAFKLTPYHAK